MQGWGFAFFDRGVDGVQNDADRGVAERFHGLTDGGERWNGKAGGDYVIEADDRAIFGNFQAGTSEAADDAEGRHVVEGHHGGEAFFVFQEFLSEFQAAFVAGVGIEGIGQIENERWIDFQVDGAGEGAHAAPARRTVAQHFRTANECNFAVSE